MKTKTNAKAGSVSANHNQAAGLSVNIIACLAATAVVGLLTTPSFAAVAGTKVSPAAANANANTPPILPVQSKPYGKSYGEWSAEFWKWEFSLPINQHPLFDTADCSAGQSGQVWFLGG